MNTLLMPRGRILGLLAPVLIIASVLIAYRNTPGNSFQLDDWHTIQENPAIRSLKNIPSFFTDARTFSVLKANVDYRPVLQTSFAINYAQGQLKTEPGDDAWHWTNIGIHCIVSCCIFFIGRRLIGSLGLAPINGLPPHIADAVVFAAALLFAIHPVTAGAVNYVSARSSSLTSMFVLLGLLSYLRGLARPNRWWRFAVCGVMLTIGLFTKVEAVSLIPALVLAEFLLNPSLRNLPLFERLFSKWSYIRLVPMILVGAVVLFIWSRQTKIINSDTRAGVTAIDYFLTQFRAWWYYVAQVFCPTRLVADYPSYPLTHLQDFKDYKETSTYLAMAGWGLVVGYAMLMMRRAPVVTFLIACFFLYLAPHSSIVPLAEPVNEHRSYLPHTCVVLLLSIGVGVAIARARSPRIVLFAASLVLAVPLLMLTRARNEVWLNDYTLWGDTVKKAPDSARVQMNYGLALMRRGEYPEAENRFRETLRLAPAYHYAFSNLAIVQLRRGDIVGAAASNDGAVRASPNVDAPYYWRALFRAEIRDVPGAAADFEKAAELCVSPFRELAGAAECLSRLGRTAEAQKYIDRGLAIDAGRGDFESQRAYIRGLLGPADSMAQMNDGLKLMKDAKWLLAEWRFREAIRLDPTNAIAHVNMGIVRSGQADPVTARQWFDAAIRIAPASDVPYYWRGRFLASQRSWDEALADFRKAQSLLAVPIRDAAALGETLIAAGKQAEGEAEFAKIDAASQQALANERADLRREVFKQR